MSDPFKRIVVDIDGTLCEDTQGKNYENAPPIQCVIDAVNSYYDAGYHVTIFTARGMHRYAGNAVDCLFELGPVTRTWLVRHGVKYHELKFGKPSADLYIDDKGISPDEFSARHPKQ